jgi:hypothetical protein
MPRAGSALSWTHCSSGNHLPSDTVQHPRRLASTLVCSGLSVLNPSNNRIFSCQSTNMTLIVVETRFTPGVLRVTLYRDKCRLLVTK